MRLIDVLVLTIVPVWGVVYVTVMAVADYRTSRQLDDWWSRSRSIHSAFDARARLALHTPSAVALERKLFPDVGTRAVNLEVPRDQWKVVAGDALLGFGEWVDAVLVRGSDQVPVKLRKRGDTSIHWTTPKVSFTMRTDRRRLVGQRRQWGFSAREPLSNYIANRLALDADLLTPASDVVPVFLNGRSYGLFRQLELIDESFLRQRRRMPGTIHRGDAIERGERFKGMPYSVFESVAVWDQVATNDRPQAPTSRLPDLLEAANGSTFADHLRLMALLDRDEMARLIAVLLMAGDPYHMDNLHNQFWYEDPSSGTFHPVPWDIRLWTLGRSTIPLNTVFRALLRDPFVVMGVQQHLRSMIDNDRAADLGEARADSIVSRLADFFRYEYEREGIIPAVGSLDYVREVLQFNTDSLRSWQHDASLAVNATPANGMWILDLESRGYTGVVLDSILFSSPPAANNPRIVLDTNRNGRLDAADQRLSPTVRSDLNGAVWVVDRNMTFHAGWTTRELRHIVPDRVHYRMFLLGTEASAVPSLMVHNRITRAPVSPVPWAAGEPIEATSTWHPWQYRQPRGREYRWSGTVALSDTMRLGSLDTLVIEPGTTVRLGPEASLIARGRMLAQGTPQAPIRFVRAETDSPWGTVALQGKGASGSRFRSVEFRGGGGAVIDGVEYIGMVNVHWATDVHLERVVFADNVRSDDTFHAVHAEVTVRQSRFERANSDAVDFDVSRGAIIDNEFDGSGGDAIDLMTSSPLIAGNTIRRAGDKGISIGEASAPLVVANTLSENAVALEVKDASEPRILRNVIHNNQVGIRVSRKNWRYGIGGWPKMLDVPASGDSSVFVMDADSRVTSVEVPIADHGNWWALAEFGVELAGEGRGSALALRKIPPTPPMLAQRYEETVARGLLGWRAEHGVRRLHYADRSLSVSFRQSGGSIALPIDVKVTTEAVLVLELAAQGLNEAAVAVVSEDRTVARRIHQPPVSFRYITVSLPAGQYDKILLTGYPHVGLQREDPTTGLIVPRYGRLALRSLAIYPVEETP